MSDLKEKSRFSLNFELMFNRVTKASYEHLNQNIDVITKAIVFKKIDKFNFFFFGLSNALAYDLTIANCWRKADEFFYR